MLLSTDVVNFAEIVRDVFSSPERSFLYLFWAIKVKNDPLSAVLAF